ncbi:MAG: hypothetical protein COB66_01585 [Coxiella sp. (in: Bacteria)]|nr:MAG: hypothetical protein COB66_01585 [Coxiella sp. (in: g-proteobacteria)]
MQCLICESKNLYCFENYKSLNRITSDCKPWAAGGELYICEQCCTVQKNVSSKWLDEIDTIYNDYEAYIQSDGEEQMVFNAATKKLCKRSEVLCDFILTHLPAGERQKLCDIGCSNGEFLSSFSDRCGEWKLYGVDLTNQYESVLVKIKNFSQFATELSQIDDPLDVISLIHTLEHLTNPHEQLAQIKNSLAGEGALFIQVPDVLNNPFDLLVADHLFHFSMPTLCNLLSQNGFSLSAASNSAVTKELSVLAGSQNTTTEATPLDFEQQKSMIQRHLQFLESIVREVSVLAAADKFSIFGSSICATWLYSYFKDDVAFFVDEDENRQGRRHMEKQIIGPDNVPGAMAIYMPLPLSVIESIMSRYPGKASNFIIPASLTTGKKHCSI